jgi:hypothetical protein
MSTLSHPLVLATLQNIIWTTTIDVIVQRIKEENVAPTMGPIGTAGGARSASVHHARATKASGNASMSGYCLPFESEKKFLPRNLIGAIKASADPAAHEEPLHRPNPIPTYAIWEMSTRHTRNAASNARLFEAAGGFKVRTAAPTRYCGAPYHIISVTRLRTESGWHFTACKADSTLEIKHIPHARDL